MKRIVIPYGCPRAGTTFLQRMLLDSVGDDCVVQKLAEWATLHPWKSFDGLLKIAELYSDYPVLFVRIKRHPISIVESFYAARKFNAELDTKTFEGIASNNDGQIIRFIVNESNSTKHQLYMKTIWPWNRFPWDFAEIRYEGMNTFSASGLGVLGYDACARCMQFTNEHFGKKPVRDGRLHRGFTDDLVTGAKLEFFQDALGKVIKDEGYRTN